MSDLRVNPKPPLPKPSGRGPDAQFRAALLVSLAATFAEYGERINDHEVRLQDAASKVRSWMSL